MEPTNAAHATNLPEVIIKGTRKKDSQKIQADESTFDKWYAIHRSQYDNRHEAFESWQGDPGEHVGESRFDRYMRLSAWSAEDARREWASGGYDMYKSPGASGGLVETLANYGSDATTAEATANLVSKRGWFDVVIHGLESGTGFVRNGQTITTEQLYNEMLANGYKQGMKIRLMSCYAGSLPEGVAAQLSKLAKAPVVAPSGPLWIAPMGSFMVNYGQQFYIESTETNPIGRMLLFNGY